jgi:hypothetical protein
MPGYIPVTITDKELRTREWSIDVVLAPISSPPVRPRPSLAPVLDENARQQAWTLTKAAIEAAHANDCDAVRALESQVRDLDEYFYDVVFEQELAIARCPATEEGP